MLGSGLCTCSSVLMEEIQPSPLRFPFSSTWGGREAACYDCVNTLFTFLFAVLSPTMLREGFYTIRATFTPQILTPQGYYNVSISVTAVFGVLFLWSVIVLDPFCSSKAQPTPALQSQGAENCSPTQHCCAQAPCPCVLCSNPHLGPGKKHCRKKKWIKIKWSASKWRLIRTCDKSVCASSVLGTKPGNELFFTGMHQLIFL